jgi:electron transfer flavoprotein alpha subunit
MARIVVIGELAPDGALTKLSAEVATLARSLADAAGAGSAVTGVIAAQAGAGAAAKTGAAELARYVPAVTIVLGVPDDAPAAVVAEALAGVIAEADVVLLPASPNGRDIAGVLSVTTGLGVLANATGARWADGGPVTEHSVFGGKLITEAALTNGRGFITVRPNVVTAEPLASPGSVSEANAPSVAASPVRVVAHEAAETAAASIEDARIIVAGGRGVGGADGFDLVEQLAAELHGAVGATRAAVDSGWIAYSQQIGQTGKIVKPSLYLALGISGAIQHKVGMQTAETIVAVNRDPDAPIAEFADVVVVGDLFEVGRALLEQLRARSG